MRLGDVLEQTADASMAARPKVAWRLGRGLLVLLLLSLAVVSFVHGPVLLFPEDHERVVLTTQWQFGAQASAGHYETEESVLFVAPLIQTATRVDGGAHTSRLDLTIATQEGIPIELPKVELRHAVHPGEGHRVHEKVGSTVSARATLAMALTRRTLLARAERLSFADLTTGTQLATTLEAAEDDLADTLRTYGIRLLQFEVEPPKLPDEFLELLQRRAAAQKTLGAAGKAKSEATSARQKALAAAHTQHQTRMGQLEIAHREALDAARASLRQAQDAADEAYTLRLRSAKGREAAMRVEAETITQNAGHEASVLAARVKGVGSNGAALLDWVIMHHVLPQLASAAPPRTPPPVPPPSPQKEAAP